MKDLNCNCPELKKLEEVASQYDFLVQEGVFYTKEERIRAFFLLKDIENLVKQLKEKK